MKEDRLTDIETKLAYHEKTIKELNDVVCEQQNEIAKLKTLCEKLTRLGREHAQMVSMINAPANDKPPHY